jgi:hypothetical protein
MAMNPEKISARRFIRASSSITTQALPEKFRDGWS